MQLHACLGSCQQQDCCDENQSQRQQHAHCDVVAHGCCLPELIVGPSLEEARHFNESMYPHSVTIVSKPRPPGRAFSMDTSMLELRCALIFSRSATETGERPRDSRI